MKILKLIKIGLLIFSLIQAPLIYANQSSDQPRQRVADTQVKQGEGVDEKLSDELIQIVTMISIGMLAKAMITYTPLTTDIKIAAAAGAVFIYSEIKAREVVEEDLDAKTFELERYENGEVNQTQKLALEKQRDSYRDISDILEQKASLQKKTAAGFFAASAVAAIWGTKLETITAKCIAAYESFAGSCNPAMGPTQPACVCLQEIPKLASFEAFLESYEKLPDSPSQKKLAALHAKDSALQTEVAATCPAALSVCGTRSKMRQALYTMSSLPFGWSIVAAIGGSVLLKELGLSSIKGLIMATLIPQAKYIDTFMSTPWLRSTAFGVMGGLVLVGAERTEEQADIMSENAQTIDKMLQKMDSSDNPSLASDNNGPQTGSTGGGNNFFAPTPGASNSLGLEEAKCPDGSDRTEQGRCNSIEQQINEGVEQTLADVNGVGGTLASAAGGIGALADEFANQGGLDEGSFEDARDITNNTNAVRDLSRNLQKELNKSRKDQGLAEVDFKQKAREFEDQIKQAAARSVRENAPGGSAARAVLAGRPLPSKDSEEQGPQEEVSSASASRPSAGQASGGYQVPSSSNGFDFDGRDLDLEEDRFSYNENGDEVTNIKEDLNSGDIDIVKNKNVSIFKVISVRYMKSGIPKLMDIEE